MFVPKSKETKQDSAESKVFCENLLLSEIIIALYHFAQTEEAPESVACVYNNTSAIFDLRDAANKYVPYNDADDDEEAELEFRLESVRLNARFGERKIFLRHCEHRNVIDATEFDKAYGAGVAQKAISAFLAQKNNIGSPKCLGNVTPPPPLRKSAFTTMFKSLSLSLSPSGAMSPGSAGTTSPGTSTPFSTSSTVNSRTTSPIMELLTSSNQLDEDSNSSASPRKHRSIVGMPKMFARPKNDGT